MQKWEHLVIGPIKGHFVADNSALLITLTDAGQDRAGLVERGVKAHDVLGKTLKRLGEEGWELVGTGSVGDGHLLYFKRPLPE